MKKLKRFTAGIIALAMMLSLLPAFGLTASAKGFDGANGGEGTASAPYEIPDLTTLEKFREYINNSTTGGKGEYFKLTADIDMSTEYNGDNNISWTPIGTSSSNQFKGTFDGDGHKITGLYINSTENYQGLFGYIGTGGTVKNLGVEGGTVTGNESVGGIAGDNDHGDITNCYNTGDVTGSREVGGIAGHNYYGTVTGSHNTGAVTGRSHVGGIVGFSSYSPVTNCHNEGNVTGSGSYVGGVAGQNQSGDITNCYNTGNVTGYGSVGGIAGVNIQCYITNCYNTGDVKGSSSYVGGVAGNSSGTVTNCYNTGNVTGSSYVGGVAGNSSGTVTNCYYRKGCVSNGMLFGTRKTEAEFKSGEVAYLLQDGQTDKDTQVWGQTLTTPADKYPVLSDNTDKKVYRVTFKYTNKDEYAYANPNGTVTVPEPESGYKWTDFDENTQVTGDITVTAVETLFEGEGTQEKPYEIPDLATLEKFRDYINSSATSGEGEYFKLTNNIEMDSNESWMPIGSTYDNMFKGTFDGNNHEITGLYINVEGAEDAENAEYQGLFGYIDENGKVKNLGVSGTVTSTGTYGGVGGIAGMNAGTIENCYNTGAVSGSGMMAVVGGIAGANSGTIENCYNTGAVSGSGMMTAVGGIVGTNGGTITNCYNTGAVSGSGVMAFVGGIAGMDQSMIKIENCYNTGAVSGTVTDIYEGLVEEIGFRGMASVGGITGVGFGMAENCYNVGKIESSVTAKGADDNVIAASGGIIGIVSALDEQVTLPENCYYLESSAEKGVGSVMYDTDTDERTIDSDVKDEAGKTEAKTAADFANMSTFVTWDFNSTWKMGETADGKYVRPILQAIAETDLDPLPAAEKFMVEIYEDSIITENGTGQYEDEVASGFVAAITSALNRASVSKLSVTAYEHEYTTENLPELTIDSGSGIVIGIIIPGITITSASDITFNIE